MILFKFALNNSKFIIARKIVRFKKKSLIYPIMGVWIGLIDLRILTIYLVIREKLVKNTNKRKMRALNEEKKKM